MRKVFLMVAAAAAMLIATGFTACKSNSTQTPKVIDIYVAGNDESGTETVAKVWKNGKELYSLANKGIARSIFIVERK